MSEKCDKCKVSLDFPTSREVLAKSRVCPACGHTQKVEKSILYVVETLEEQVEWLSERIAALEEGRPAPMRPKPHPVPPRRAVVQAPPVDLLAERPLYSPNTSSDIDLFGIETPAQCHMDDVRRDPPQELVEYLKTAPKLGTLKDVII